MSLSLENFLIQTLLKMSPFVIYRREFKDKKSIKTSPLPPPCWLNWNLWSFSKCQTSLSINPNLKCTFPTIAKLSLRKLVFGPKLPFGLNQISVPEVFNTLIFCIFVYTPLPLTGHFNWNFAVTFTKDHGWLHTYCNFCFTSVILFVSHLWTFHFVQKVATSQGL